jgi:transcriptional regulator with XRE-family HTH domain
MTVPGQLDLLVLGKAIRALREERGISPDDLGDVAGVDAHSLDDLENGRLDPRYDLLVRLAQGIGVEPHVIVRRAEQIAKDS